MASVRYDDLLASRKDADSAVCPAGTYDVKVHSADYGKSSSGRDMVTVKFEITSGPRTGRRLTHWMTIVPEHANLVDQWFRQMAAFGLDEQYFQAGPTNEQVERDLLGRTAQIEVGVRKKRGTDEDTEDIKRVMPPSGGQQPLVAGGVVPGFPSSQAVGLPGPGADPSAPDVPF